MGIPSRNPGLYIGFPSFYISKYFTSVKFDFPLVASIITCWLCMKHVSEIGVLIWKMFFCSPPLRLCTSVVSVYKPVGWWFIFVTPTPSCPQSSYSYTISSPTSSYVQVGLDNLEWPLNRSPSPCAQVRGLIGLWLVDDWSGFLFRLMLWVHMVMCTVLLSPSLLRSWASGFNSPLSLWVQSGMYWTPIRLPWC